MLNPKQEPSHLNIFTARIRRMTGGYIFTLCVSPHLGGGYLPSGWWGGVSTQVWVGRVPTFPGLGGGGTYLPRPGWWGYLPFQVWMGGTYLGRYPPPGSGTPPPG